MMSGSTIPPNPSSRLFAVVLCLGFLLSAPAIAQVVDSGYYPNGLDSNYNPSALLRMPTTYSTTPGTGVLLVTVYAERNPVHLDRQALMKLTNVKTQTAVWRTTEDTSQGLFTNIVFGSYDVEVSAVGYLSSHKEVKVADNVSVVQLELVLHRDPEAVNLDIADEVLSSKARKQTKRAVSALKSSNLNEAEKRLNEAYSSAPSSPELNFLLGYLYFQKKDFTKAGSYLSTATSLSPHNSQALTLLGRTGLERQDYPAARSALEQAIMADDENWLPHNLLADAYLHQKSYDKARDEAQVAIAKGKNNAGPAQLVLGEALLGLGQNEQGIQALNVFLQQSPGSSMAGPVRKLISDVETVEKNRGSSSGPPASSGSAAGTTEANLSGVDPTLALGTPGLSMKMWQPPGVDEVQLALAPGVTCPSSKVIDESGKRVQELADDVTRFSAVEDLFHQPLDEFGNPAGSETRKYNYVASISEPRPGLVAINEYRADNLTVNDYPGHIASTGLAALAFVFHPHVRDSFEMVCEGLGDWHGQPSWLVHFRQRKDQFNSMHAYKVGDQTYPVDMKGRAWITADNFQIVRIEAEMVRPMPEIELLSEHQIVEYGPVPFEKGRATLWLPKTGEIYLDFRRHKFYRRHSFDHYMLFSVDSIEKRKEPGTKPADKPN